MVSFPSWMNDLYKQMITPLTTIGTAAPGVATVAPQEKPVDPKISDMVEKALNAMIDMDPADCTTLVLLLTGPMIDFNINSPHRIAAFLGQTCFESEYFQKTEENLNYSAARLLQVFPTHVRDMNDAATLAHNPEALANRVYSNRIGNGPPPDGWLYHGRGYIEITGLGNYTPFAQDNNMTLDEAVKFMSTPRGAAFSAAWWWAKHALNEKADIWNLSAITQTINGGQSGAGDRIALCTSALKAIN